MNICVIIKLIEVLSPFYYLFHSPNDCFDSYSTPFSSCSGKQNCTIFFTTALTRVPNCGLRKAKYFYIQYQCVPGRFEYTWKTNLIKSYKFIFSSTYFLVDQAAGNPVNKNLCLSNGNDMIATSAAAIYQSPDYPSFPKTASNCIKNITTTPGQYLLVYLNSAIFIGSNTKLVIVDFI